MMAHLPLESAVTITAGGIDTATSGGTIITSSASANTKGSWTQISASIPSDVVGLWVAIRNDGTGYRYLMDLSVGSGNSVVVENIHWLSRPNCGRGWVYLPIALPGGEPLYARVSNNVGSKAAHVAVYYVCGTFNSSRAYSVGTPYGITAASTEATSVDPGGSANTKGSWVEITSSTTRTIRSLLLMARNDFDSSSVVQQWLVDVGVGAAGSEVVLLPNLYVNIDSSSDSVQTPFIGPFDVTIPAGTRVAIRCQTDNITSATLRVLRLAFIGFD